MSAIQLAIVLAPRSKNYDRVGFQCHYEDFHAPLFSSFGKVRSDHLAKYPPSTASGCPVIKLALAEHRNRTAPATSFG